MMIRFCFFLLLAGFSINSQAQDVKGLQEYYSSYFTMGVAVSPRSLASEAESALIKKHFGSITAENVMKPGPIHPAEDTYVWGPADQVVEFAQANGMKVRGHTLCWHNQTPDWFFKDENGNTASKELVLSRLKKHIETVVGRYKGKIYAWDVVNEAVPDSPEGTYRDSQWYKIVGEEYIARAFEYAHAADPDAILFYNDYNTEQPKKREKILTIVKKLLADGVPIHGVGLQGHWSINDPSAEELEKSINSFADLGLTVQITELDVSVYSNSPEERSATAPQAGVFTPEREQKQLERYKMIMEVCRKNKDKLSGITFWNVSDRTSWLDNFPVRGRKNFPLLFDQNLQPKKVFFEVTSFEK
ncbi:endo-1,4-beta-xylanase [Arundinibacter roseus]|nr:endo-1,4-beta-xylanase [Arundinibacter roseus]